MKRLHQRGSADAAEVCGMTPARAAKILRLYNAWRRGYGEQSDVPSPELIGEAIDVAVGYITRAKPTKRAPAQRKEES